MHFRGENDLLSAGSSAGRSLLGRSSLSALGGSLGDLSGGFSLGCA